MSVNLQGCITYENLHAQSVIYSLSPIRIPITLILHIEIPMDMLRRGTGRGAFFAKFARAAGIFHPAERTGVMVGERIVDPDRPGF